MIRKLNERFSVQLAKNPARVVLAAILFFNLIFLAISAAVISALSLTGTESMGFWEAIFCTVTMILDAGCIQFVIADIGQSGVVIVVFCLAVVVIGMIMFTGAVIGYVTNYISGFIENSNAGNRRLNIFNHTVILNWNSRASEIINDLLYCTSKRKVVVLVNGRKKEVEKEIEERISDTLMRERAYLRECCEGMPFAERRRYLRRNKFKENVTVIVREGDTFSTKQLRDISLERAKSVIILGNDINNTVCKFDYRERAEEHERGNSQTIKTLVQVAEITGAEYSDDGQKIIVEIDDDWTLDLVNKIIKCKQVDGKCNIVPVSVNRVLGQILSQFSLMPELNLAYKELFSNKGAAFYSYEQPAREETSFITQYMSGHINAIPLTLMESGGVTYGYYSAASERDIRRESDASRSGYTVSINRDYHMERKNIIILGHNSKSADIMRGFNAFCDEWNQDSGGGEIIRVIVIDDKKHLEKLDYYREYPYVIDTIEADIYDRDKICSAIEAFVDSSDQDTSILILSDDTVINEDIDANAIANLIYVQDIINRRKEADPDFDTESMDVVVEILNPKHHDIVNSYSVNNVVISNRYISKMITQIGEKEALFDLYNDILTYDSADAKEYESKEIYVKKVSKMFAEPPGECTAEELIRAVYSETAFKPMASGKLNPTIVLGYTRPGGEMVLFSGDQSKIKVKLDECDKMIVFSNH